MRLIIDDTKLYIDESVTAQKTKERLTKIFSKKFRLPNGVTVDLTSKSIVSVALRQVVTFFLPMLQYVADELNIELPIKEKHSDPIPYAITCITTIMEEGSKGTDLILKCIPNGEGDNVIINKVSIQSNLIEQTEEVFDLLSPLKSGN